YFLGRTASAALLAFRHGTSTVVSTNLGAASGPQNTSYPRFLEFALSLRSRMISRSRSVLPACVRSSHFPSASIAEPAEPTLGSHDHARGPPTLAVSFG